MTWGEVIRKLKAAGYVEVRSGKAVTVNFGTRRQATKSESRSARRRTPVSWATGFSGRQGFDDDLLPDCD